MGGSKKSVPGWTREGSPAATIWRHGRLCRLEAWGPGGQRGGSWNNETHNIRCAYRNRNNPDNRNNNGGFRCVLQLAGFRPECRRPTERRCVPGRTGAPGSRPVLRSLKHRANIESPRPLACPRGGAPFQKTLRVSKKPLGSLRSPLYRQVYSFGNLFAAYRAARRGKRRRPEVAAFEFNAAGCRSPGRPLAFLANTVYDYPRRKRRPLG